MQLLGKEAHAFFIQSFPDTNGKSDLCAFFFRRAYKELRASGTFGLVATNTIGQGDTREASLTYVNREDVKVTDTLTEAGKLLGINVLDHIIHGDGTGEVLSIRES